MRRREFIAGLGGAVAWPRVARAQQGERVRQLGILWLWEEKDPLRKAWFDAFLQGLAEHGWTEGRNLRINVRWNPQTPEQIRTSAKELVDRRPDVLATSSVRLVRAMQEETQTIPIVMLGAGDPLASGIVKSLARPERNTTGVTDIFPSIAGKWLELKQCEPGLTRAALVFNPDVSNAVFTDTIVSAATQAGAQQGVKTVTAPVRNAEDIRRAIVEFAAEPGGGIIVVPPSLLRSEREVINRLALQYRLPAGLTLPPIGGIGLALAVGVAYFFAARLSLALLAKPDGVAVFWPAAGVSSGVLIALGRAARLPVASGVIVATIIANLMGDRNVLNAIASALLNTGEALLAAWLIERYFGSPFSLDRLPNVLALLAAAIVATAASGIGGMVAYKLFHSPTTPIWTTWRHWFASDAVGLITVAPLVIGLARALREPPRRNEIIEGVTALVALAVMTARGRRC